MTPRSLVGSLGGGDSHRLSVAATTDLCLEANVPEPLTLHPSESGPRPLVEAAPWRDAEVVSRWLSTVLLAAALIAGACGSGETTAISATTEAGSSSTATPAPATTDDDTSTACTPAAEPTSTVPSSDPPPSTSTASTQPDSSTTASTTATTVTTATSSTTATTATTTATTEPDAGTTPSTTAAGDAALAANQRRLSELGYWLGPVDGRWGSLTAHATTAFQKAEGLDRTGQLDAPTVERLASATTPTPRSTAGTVLEIDLARQILLVASNGTVTRIYDIATGAPATPTPAGQFTIYREIDGIRDAPLGRLYRPKYFNGGIALHGYTSVPSQPASHGCVRLTYPAMDDLWATGAAPVGTPVLVY